MRFVAPVVGLLLGAACASGSVPYAHNRYDYAAFKARAGALPEPNYVPWLMHRERLPGGSEALVACRWPHSAFPLRVHVAPPVIPGELQDEFNPRDPRDYVLAVERAFDLWEEALGRPIRFVSVDSPAQAQVVVYLEASPQEEPEGWVLGRLREEQARCRLTGTTPDPARVGIEYSVSEAWLYVADDHGLLTPRQVQAVALHEIGHILGASGQHSPLQGDVMYRIADDRRVESLSEHDQNSLRALYRIEPGALYVRLDQRHDAPLTEVRRAPPRLGPELEDERFGFRVRFPIEWQVIRSPRGWVAVDGVSWDYDASLQVIALRGTLDAYMEAQRATVLPPDVMASRDEIEMDGKPIGRIVMEQGDRTEVVTVQDWAAEPGWVLAVVSDCRTADYALYQPWFWSTVLSLEPLGASADLP